LIHFYKRVCLVLRCQGLQSQVTTLLLELLP